MGEKHVSTLPLIIQADARLAILGSFPGVASLQAQQYYAHSRNQFWVMIGAVFGEPQLKEQAYEKKIDFLKKKRVALWDVYQACERKGSLDADIKKGELNDLAVLLQKAPSLKVIAHNGQASGKYKDKTKGLGVEVLVLPSTSPAYAGMKVEDKIKAWEHAFVRAGIV